MQFPRFYHHQLHRGEATTSVSPWQTNWLQWSKHSGWHGISQLPLILMSIEWKTPTRGVFLCLLLGTDLQHPLVFEHKHEHVLANADPDLASLFWMDSIPRSLSIDPYLRVSCMVWTISTGHSSVIIVVFLGRDATHIYIECWNKVWYSKKDRVAEFRMVEFRIAEFRMAEFSRF